MHATVHNLKFIFLIFILIKASHSWGFSISRTDQYIQQAKDKKLWQDPQWIKLGHYQTNLLGQISSPFKQGLFLDSEGANSPEKELLTTIESLYSDAKMTTEQLGMHPQCYYLARSTWLQKKLNLDPQDILPCENRQQWKKNLNAQSVAIIFAASDLGNASSSFGHTFLKVINPNNAKNKDLIDYGVDYSAQTDASEGLLYAVKGLVGVYPGRFAMMPFHQKTREYLNVDGRDIWEYHLNFTPDEVDFLISHLLEMERARAPYYFFDENCSYQILKTLEVVRPDMDISDSFGAFVIPIDTVKKVLRDTNWISDIRYKKSLKNDYMESYLQLNSEQRSELKKIIENQKPESIPDGFSPQQKAEILEAGQKYYAVQAFKTGNDFDPQIYNLSVERAMLGSIPDNKPVQKPQPPHDSHDSSAVKISYINNQKDHDEKYQFKFRSAMHELIQNDFGTVPMSHTELASIAIDHYVDRKTEATQFSHVTLLNLINLNPSNELQNHFSWKALVEIYNNWDYILEGSGGASADLFKGQRLRVAAFMTGREWMIDDQQYTGVGPELLGLAYITDNLAISVSSKYLLMNKRSDLWCNKINFNYNFAKNWDLQLSYESNIQLNDPLTISLMYGFVY